MRQILDLALVAIVVATAAHFGFQITYGATPSFWLIVGVPTLVLAAYACLRLGHDGELSSLLRPAFGDFTKGFLGAAALFALAVGFTKLVTPPGSPRESWLIRIYLQTGDPSDMRAHLGVFGFSVFVIAAAEEIVWRGLVTRALAERIGVRRAWVYAAVLYALAHAPTLFALSDPRLGPNPLVVVAALGGGLLWGGMTRAFGRLPPAILAHALFNWCALILFRLWGGSV